MYDAKAALYGPVFCAPHNTSALRMFGDEITRNRDSLMSKYPDDFALYYLGELDSSTGFILPCEQPVFLAAALEFVSSPTAVEPTAGR
jgi:hypothetical protein